MNPLCIIPARAGSKRLPRKNVVNLNGRPLLAYTIEAAAQSGVFDRVYVSTEDAGIAAQARSFGADVPFLRPVELAGDEVTNVAVALHFFDTLVGHQLGYDAIVCLQPSSPLRRKDEIREAWDRFVDERRDFLVSVTHIDPHYFHWAMNKENGEWGMFFGERFKAVRQRLPQVFRPNGAIKIARPEALRDAGDFFGKNLGVFEMPEETSVHVATALDLALCATLLRFRG